MTFFTTALREDHQGWLDIPIGIAALVLLCYQVLIEIRQQAYSESFWDYFKSLVNIVDMFQFITAFLLIILHITQIEFPSIETQRVIASITTLCLWIKVLDWCKLFQPTSFFIRLITETIYDIRYFSVIFLVCLAMFGFPMYMLQLNRTQDNAVVESVFGEIWPLNAIYNQYMLSLGEFTMDAFDENPQ